QAGNLKQHHARLDHGGPVFRLALALAHAGFGGGGGYRFFGGHAGIQPAPPPGRGGGRGAARLDGLGARPTALQRLPPLIAGGHRVAARGVTFYFAALAFSELYSLGHERHDYPPGGPYNPRY